ncbi:unnamed protein product [Amaranthus hypochondriacus]
MELQEKLKSGTFKLLFCIFCYFHFTNNIILSDAMDLPSYANVSSSWNITWPRDILASQGHGTYPSFTLGAKYFGIYYEIRFAIFLTTEDLNSDDPICIWYSRLDYYDEATLELTLDGLVLMDTKSGTILWSTNTSGLSVESMHLKDDGNLVLLNTNGDPVWESHRHPSPTNVLFYDKLKQGVSIGQRLTSNRAPFNSAAFFYVDWGIDGLHAYFDFLDPPQQYQFWDYQAYNSTISEFIKSIDIAGYNFSYLFLDIYGHLNGACLNLSDSNSGRYESSFDDNSTECSYPMECGNYGVCFESECSCPTGNEGSLNYFRPLNRLDITSGCTLLTPLSCSAQSRHHDFLELQNVTYFYSTPSLVGTDVMSCKTACLNQCSCKAIIFRYYHHSSFGNCSLPSEILTLMDVSNKSMAYQVITFLKVQTNASMTVEASSSERNIAIFVSTSLAILVFVIGTLCFVFIRAKNTSKKYELSLNILVDNISRFSFESLKLATQDFQTRLGRGGFGSVYIGTLVDGTQVAVKCLDSCHQGTKEFLAEVNTIGSIHHFNLVKLIGFCNEGSNRLLVYEYMCNGSLDKWIFDDGFCQTLTWNIRRRIIEGVAAGLEYLHEHCHKNVIHFDIKPQNILLDKDFNVKISDFGLAKMVDRDESQVMTVVKGTPGYMAPELINGRAISVKVDVYSFGMVILELVCGRKNFSSAEEDILTNLLKVKADEDQLCDLIDVRVHDMQQEKDETVNMIKIAIWCLQPHFIRPTMPKVVKVLQDFSNMEALNDLSDITMAIETNAGEATYSSSFRPADSLLSGPR